MVKTIGNPLTWSARFLGAIGSHATASIAELRGELAPKSPPRPRYISIDDVRAALRAGMDDFAALRSDVLMLVFLYPVLGLVLVWFASDMNLLPLIFPLVAGFALVGPFAAVGLYQMSGRREAGKPVRWTDAFSVISSPSFVPIIVLGMVLLGIFLAWMAAARIIYDVTLGPVPPETFSAFFLSVVTTASGWLMVILGFVVGFIFAFVVLAISVVSFPLLIDRHVGLTTAIETSIRVTLMNPRPICTWGLMVACGLALGSVPFLLGLVIVLPVLGHATWHLYRRAVTFGKD